MEFEQIAEIAVLRLTVSPVLAQRDYASRRSTGPGLTLFLFTMFVLRSGLRQSGSEKGTIPIHSKSGLAIPKPTANFRGLVLGCIEATFNKQTLS